MGMNPMASAAVQSIIRWALTFGAGWLVRHGVWTEGDAASYVAAAAMGIVALGWSLWDKYKARLTILTALTMSAGKTTEEDVQARIATVPAAALPALTTPITAIPAPKGA